jgi:hypothetical protein
MLNGSPSPPLPLSSMLWGSLPRWSSPAGFPHPPRHHVGGCWALPEPSPAGTQADPPILKLGGVGGWGEGQCVCVCVGVCVSVCVCVCVCGCVCVCACIHYPCIDSGCLWRSRMYLYVTKAFQTVTAQSPHSHRAVTAQSPHSHRLENKAYS